MYKEVQNVTFVTLVMTLVSHCFQKKIQTNASRLTNEILIATSGSINNTAVMAHYYDYRKKLSMLIRFVSQSYFLRKKVRLIKGDYFLA